MINYTNRRYYNINITRDTLGDVSVRIWNGSLDNNRGGLRVYAFNDEVTALAFVDKKVKEKEKGRSNTGGYSLVYEGQTDEHGSL